MIWLKAQGSRLKAPGTAEGSRLKAGGSYLEPRASSLERIASPASSVFQRGQSTLEYAVLIAVVVGACLVMQIYMKRGVSGKLQEGTQRIGEQFTPYTATHTLTQGFTGARTETTTAVGTIASAIDAANPETQTRTGAENPVDSDMTVETLWSKN